MSRAILWMHEDGGPGTTEAMTIFWQQYLSEPMGHGQQISLPQLIRDEPAKWKSQYINWIRATAPAEETRGRRVTAREYWWYWLPSQFAFGFESIPYTAMRLWALMEQVDHSGTTEIQVVGCEQAGLRKVLEGWARSRNVTLAFDPTTPKATTLSLLPGLRMARHVIRALMVLTEHFVTRYRPKHLTDAPGALVFVDYFTQLKPPSKMNGHFASNYWTLLPQTLADIGTSATWVHLDVRTRTAPTLQDARGLISALNATSSDEHVLLQDSRELRTFVQIFFFYLRLFWIGSKTWALGKPENCTYRGVSMRGLVQPAFDSAHFGVQAAQNAIWFGVTEELAKRTRTRTPLIYLMENQPWEFALLRAWRRHNGGSTHGVVHSAVRYWDTRFLVPAYSPSVELVAPMPDVVLSNGSAAQKQLESVGYTSVKAVEALRYIPKRNLARPHTGSANKCRHLLNLLIIGEYEVSMAQRQVAVANSVSALGATKVQVTFRPHPSTSFLINELHDKINVDLTPTIDEALAASDVVLVGAVSSALVDSLHANKPTVLLTDARFLGAGIGGLAAKIPEADSARDVLNLVYQRPRAGGPSMPTKVFDRGPLPKKWNSVLDELLP